MVKPPLLPLIMIVPAYLHHEFHENMETKLPRAHAGRIVSRKSACYPHDDWVFSQLCCLPSCKLTSMWQTNFSNETMVFFHIDLSLPQGKSNVQMAFL